MRTNITNDIHTLEVSNYGISNVLLLALAFLVC